MHLLKSLKNKLLLLLVSATAMLALSNEKNDYNVHLSTQNYAKNSAIENQPPLKIKDQSDRISKNAIKTSTINLSTVTSRKFIGFLWRSDIETKNSNAVMQRISDINDVDTVNLRVTNWNKNDLQYCSPSESTIEVGMCSKEEINPVHKIYEGNVIFMVWVFDNYNNLADN